MPEQVICNTSPVQYLHQLGLLHILPRLCGKVIFPAAVIRELAAGRKVGVDLPDLDLFDWAVIASPKNSAASSLVTDLGAGETEVLALALEYPDPLVILDDLLARRMAEYLKLPLTGTLGLLLDAKKAGLVQAVGPCLDRLERLRFRIAAPTYRSVLRMAGEE